MIRLVDPEQLDRDELAERRRERDQQREPSSRRRRVQSHLAKRHAYQAKVIDDVNVHLETAAARVECPACCGPVYVPADSRDERVDCFACDARLVSVQAIEGVTVMELEPDGAS